LASKQRETCARLRLDYLPCEPHLKIGIARNVREGVLPIHGLRHAPEGDTSGWYIWAGGEPSADEEFFVPIHASHVNEWSPLIEPFLGLPVGYRFLIAPDAEDVWFDEAVLRAD
jgi:hypothetical protein